MSLLTPTDARHQHLGLTILRVFTGIIFAAHGAQKLFVFGFAGVSGAFGQMNVPIPSVLGPISTMIELVGGLALIIGFLTRLVGLGLAADMLGALLFVHLRNGFFLPNGYEFVFTLMGSALALAVAGPGDYSVDARISERAATPRDDPAMRSVP